MKYAYTIEEFDKATERWVRSVNAYSRLKTAEQVCEYLNAEAELCRTGKEYIVFTA